VTERWRRNELRTVPGVVTAEQLAATVEAIAADQLSSGMILWFPGGHSDPWNHVEAAMALDVGGRREEAEAAYRWLARAQRADGSWFNYYLANGVEDRRLDTNVIAYVAVGLWHHTLLTGDSRLMAELWPTVERAMQFVLDLQQEGGEVVWCREPEDNAPGRYALLTGSSSIYLSLRCAVAAALHLGEERPDWELAAGRLAHAVAHRREAFADKDRWAMDWYYPVLCGALTGEAGRARLQERWGEFVMPGRGVRCVSDQPWVTAAETAECAMAHDAVGLRDEAVTLLAWAQGLRDRDGSYWTGCVYPDEVHFPGGERSSYTAAAIVLAANALTGDGPAAGLFRGESLPERLDLVADLPEVASADPDA
jgi:hypothetical protein